MRVILTTERVLYSGVTQFRGQEIDVSPEEALRLIKAGQAESLDLIETAMDEPRDEFRGVPKTRRYKHGTPVK